MLRSVRLVGVTRTPPAPPSSFARRAAATTLLTAAVFALGACSSDIDSGESGGGTTSTSTTAASTTTAAPTSTESTTTTAAPTTTTTEPIVTAPGVVKVANASGVDGAAGVLSDELKAMGFDTRDATNGAGIDEDLKVSKIYVIEGSEAVAKSISRLMGGIEMLPMTTPAWIIGANENLADATVLVMLGHDLAGKKLAQMAG